MLELFVIVYLSTLNMHLRMHTRNLLVSRSPGKSHLIVVSFHSKRYNDAVSFS